MSRVKKNIGDWGESQACLFLERQGFRVMERNFYTTVGEIDIVAEKKGDWYFVEVKTRENGEMANDLAITLPKKFKIGKTIRKYCYQRGLGDVGMVAASLLVVYDRASKKVNFRLAVLDLPN